MNIIAYGSLMNQRSLAKTLQRSVQLNTITVPNVQRIFNAPFGNYAFLNVAKAKGASIEAAYFELHSAEIEKFAERESGSELLQLLPGYFAFVWPKKDCNELPVLQSYIEVCELGSRQLGINFWLGTITPQIVIDDSENPLYA